MANSADENILFAIQLIPARTHTQIDCPRRAKTCCQTLTSQSRRRQHKTLPPPPEHECGLALPSSRFNKTREIQIELRLNWTGFQCVCVCGASRCRGGTRPCVNTHTTHTHTRTRTHAANTCQRVLLLLLLADTCVSVFLFLWLFCPIEKSEPTTSLHRSLRVGKFVQYIFRLWSIPARCGQGDGALCDCICTLACAIYGKKKNRNVFVSTICVALSDAGGVEVYYECSTIRDETCEAKSLR